MSNLIPYFVLAVVALGFFAVCYAVFSGGDGESKAKEKSYKNISNKNKTICLFVFCFCSKMH